MNSFIYYVATVKWWYKPLDIKLEKFPYFHMPANRPAVPSSDHAAALLGDGKYWSKCILSASSTLEISFLCGMIASMENKCF